ncbi:Gfo/Idh/MocA family protein [Paenibacillus sp. S150]|uniref:Gfo/Idh/MocA family protein n=1 Tax=Paenibacillus sp. S150 TaxID=2749826 RepID=UPI001C5669C4|nr:Gfo/Idh/MocA family oxidoreductase [Paenibacillus sp. S150]MBW4082519.1 Gfo/Idh/MocA family oxidoreductase [Paenibacillus sp. S150]
MKHIVLIGCGAMGGAHLYSYLGMPGVKVAGIVDLNPEKAEQFALQAEAQAFTTLEEALRTLEQVDVVDVCVPTYLHKEYVLAAARHHKHVICEKPLAGNLEDAAEMIEYCKSRQVRLFVGHVLRFFPEYEKVKEQLDSGSIGEAGVVRMSRVGSMPAGFEDWYSDIKLSGGVVMDLSIHDIDFLRWCFGEVERVYAKSLQGRSGNRLNLGYGLVTLRFRNGVIAHAESSWAHEEFSSKLEFAGAGGMIEYDSSRDKPLSLTRRRSQEAPAGVAVPVSTVEPNPYARELQHFLECVDTGAEARVTAEDGYKALEIVLAAIRSMETGDPVSLNNDN